MEAFDEELIGISKKDTVLAYLARDIEFKKDPKNVIEIAFKKLGYIDFDKELRINQHINNTIQQYIKKSNDVISGNEIENLKENIKNSDKFKCFIDELNTMENRAKELSGFVGSSDTKAFYDALTLEELEHLGY